MLLIGSRAAKFWFEDAREPKDYDVICTGDEFAQVMADHRPLFKSLQPKGDYKYIGQLRVGGVTVKAEFEMQEAHASAQLMAARRDSLTTHSFLPGETLAVASPNVLLTLKAATIGEPVHWRKNIEDYHFLKDHGAQYVPDVFFARSRETRARVAQNRPARREDKTTASNEEFFGHFAITREFDHDLLHRLTCFGARPLFERLKRDLDEAAVWPDLFWCLTPRERVQALQEECVALALERKLVPLYRANSPVSEAEIEAAYFYALQKICTTLADNPAWVKQFAQEHYPEIADFPRDYYARFRAAIAEPSGTSLDHEQHASL